MSKISNPTKVITGVNTRWSYANVWDAKSINGGTPKYSVSLIIPKSDTVTVTRSKPQSQPLMKKVRASSRVMARPFLLSPYSKHLSAMVIWRDLMIRLTQTHTSLTPTALQHLAS